MHAVVLVLASVSIFRSQEMVDESALFVGETDSAPLLYRADAVRSVMSHDGKVAYEEGRDWRLDRERNVLRRVKGSRIPFLRVEDVYFRAPPRGVRSIECVTPERRFMLCGDDGAITSNQVMVSYFHRDGWTGVKANDESAAFEPLTRRLAAGEKARVLFYGDSITCGYTSSKLAGTAPGRPSWAERVHEEICRRTGNRRIEYVNTAVKGTGVNWGITHIRDRVVEYSPQLAVIAFGMNDSDPPESYCGYVRRMVDAVRGGVPGCAVLLVSPMPPNPEAKAYQGPNADKSLYERALAALVQEYRVGGVRDVGLANVNSVYASVLARKRFIDMTGNNINHCNDFSSRIYAETVLSAIFGEKTANAAFEEFCEPPMEFRPWTYYWWMNGHADEGTIERDLASIASLGFGGILFFDMRNYWDDDQHLVLPKPEVEFMSERWNDLVAHTVRECDRQGLVFSMNASSSGGTLAGYRNGKLYEVDISDRRQVEEHLERLFCPIFSRIGDLAGKTFRQIYSVSWEGSTPKGGDPRAMSRRIYENFYVAMRDWAHAHGLCLSSESGGPWRREQGDFVGADQLEFLSVNDVPQGEFWLKSEKVFFCSPVANAARVYGRRIAAAEAFTHMEHHWSVVPEDLKRQGDRAFADGINRFVWHGFTCSPRRFGVPGLEYFAGTHINRNVTWHQEAKAFVKYLARCQSLLQRGEAVADVAVLAGDAPYRHWGHYDDEPWEGSGIKMPRGCKFDVLTARAPESARSRYASAVDATCSPVKFPQQQLPDCDIPRAWDFAHRRDGGSDFYFVVGEGCGEGIFRTSAKQAEIWDPVTGCRWAAPFSRLGDGRALMAFDLPANCSLFVVFGEAADGKALPVSPLLRPGCEERLSVSGPWEVEFSYPDGIEAEPPRPRTMKRLENWGKSRDAALRAFSGKGIYRTRVVLDDDPNIFDRIVLNLGSVGVGVAHVSVNNVDCGTVWSSPWQACVSGTLRKGGNEIEIQVVNTWANRLAADARLDPSHQATHTNVKRLPTHGLNRFAGYDLDFSPQNCGLLGPVWLEFSRHEFRSSAQSSGL